MRWKNRGEITTNTQGFTPPADPISLKLGDERSSTQWWKLVELLRDCALRVRHRARYRTGERKVEAQSAEDEKKNLMASTQTGAQRW